ITGIEIQKKEEEKGKKKGKKEWMITLVKWHVTTVEGTVDSVNRRNVDKVNGVMQVTKKVLEEPRKLSDFLNRG
ncbi:MAG: hypothetical protein QGG26_13755, partial [Candidatus Undinarchaeales archaeon]|nr:hypothetical protein [Candidatus Undinarchaeales archaeon]